MKIEDQLLEKQSELFKIIAFADEIISKLEQFSKILTENEKALFDKYALFDLARFSFWDVAILEVCKLYNPEEKYSLHKILNIAINNYSKISWKVTFNLKELNDLQSCIDQQKNLISRLIGIRDHFIAHLDDKQYMDSLVISELRLLLDLSQIVYNKINLGLNGSEMTWDSQNDTSDMNALKNLTKFEALRNHILVNDFKGEKLISIEDLIKILENPSGKK
jgi:hypothetical protein